MEILSHANQYIYIKEVAELFRHWTINCYSVIKYYRVKVLVNVITETFYATQICIIKLTKNKQKKTNTCNDLFIYLW